MKNNIMNHKNFVKKCKVTCEFNKLCQKACNDVESCLKTHFFYFGRHTGCQ